MTVHNMFLHNHLLHFKQQNSKVKHNQRVRLKSANTSEARDLKRVPRYKHIKRVIVSGGNDSILQHLADKIQYVITGSLQLHDVLDLRHVREAVMLDTELSAFVAAFKAITNCHGLQIISCNDLVGKPHTLSARFVSLRKYPVADCSF